jgi:hypothetical protein
MNAIDIDRGAPPQTHGSGRRRSSTRQWGAALRPTAVGGGAHCPRQWGAANPPRPHGRGRPGLARGGGGQVGPDPGQPPHRPTRAPPGPRLRPQAGGQGAAAPRPCGSGDRGGDLRSPEGGKGPRFGGYPPLSEASPAPSLGRAAKFWGQCSLHCPPCPKIRKNHRGSITFFLQLQIQNYFFSLKGITLAHLPLKSQHFVHAFDAMRAYPNSPKTHLRTLVL